MTEKELTELVDLAHAHIESRLTPAQRVALESAIEGGGEPRRVVADLLRDHATLYWEHVGQAGEEPSIEHFRGSLPPSPLTGSRSPAPQRRWWRLAMAAALTLSALGAGLYVGGRDSSPPVFATLMHADAATWGGGNLPTANGSRLSQGLLRLEEGLATILFDSGARVTLEAPAVFELTDAMNAHLLAGTLVADVPESAHGFRIETPSARVIDHGTRFAVNVESATGTTRTHVFDGLVEVMHPRTDKVVKLRAGERNRVAGDQLDPASAGPAESDWAPGRTLRRSPEWLLLSTRDGTGKDGYAASIMTDHRSDILLLVKSTAQTKGPRRKAYLGFDLSLVTRDQLEAAELILHFEPTGFGLASALPDSEFEVHGLVKESGSEWEPGILPWASAPANVVANNSLDPASVQLLGRFTIPRGVQKGEFTLQSEALRQFLKADADGRVTLIVSRKTLELEEGGLVHGFASSRHPSLPPPTLALKLRSSLPPSPSR